MQTEFIILKQTVLSNNCPECYAQDTLKLVFKQEKSFSKFYIKIKKGFMSSMNCSQCGCEIYPGMYTDDIERVYDYHKKTIQPKPASIHFTAMFYGLVFLIMVVCAFGIAYAVKPELFNL